VIGDEHLTSIDFLKVDVEGAELDVLGGISDENLGIVKQLVVEISPANKRSLRSLIERLRSNGFGEVHLQSMGHKSDPFRDAWPCNLFARRA